MRHNRFTCKLQSGKVKLATSKAVGNATVKVSAAPFPQVDNLYYQIEKHGDFIQEIN
jgi:hypothetical protein